MSEDGLAVQLDPLWGETVGTYFGIPEASLFVQPWRRRPPHEALPASVERSLMEISDWGQPRIGATETVWLAVRPEHGSRIHGLPRVSGRSG